MSVQTKSYLCLFVLVLCALSQSVSAQEVQPTVTPNLTPPALITDRALTIGESAEKNWSPPINLSRSGATTSPTLFTDGQHTLHVLWLDTLDGMTYMQGDGVTWTTPVRVFLPFGTVIPDVYIDAAQIAHVHWLDVDENLFYATVETTDFVDPSAWSEPTLIVEGAKAATIIESADRLHLIYLQGRHYEMSSAGIYIRSTSDSRSDLLPAVMITTSPYLRLVAPETANLTASIVGETLYVAWDDPGQDQIWLAKSVDDGIRWNMPKIIDQRAEGDAPTSMPPTQIRILEQEQHALVTWFAGHTNVACGQFFQSSDDDGATFSPRQQIFGDLQNCPSSTHLLSNSSDTLLMLTHINDLTFLTQRQGGEWRNHTPQPQLTRFTDPVTLRDVLLGCLDAVRLGEDIYVVGCDNGVGQDIWLTRRDYIDALTSQETLTFEPSIEIAEPAIEPSQTTEPLSAPLPVEGGLQPQDYWVIGGLLLLGLVLALAGALTVLRKKG